MVSSHKLMSLRGWGMSARSNLEIIMGLLRPAKDCLAVTCYLQEHDVKTYSLEYDHP